MQLKNKNKIRSSIKGFTLVELVISIGIFALMTGVLLSKYGNFNQGVILTNLAYDVALAIRTSQSYGINVKSAPTTSANYSNSFQYGYGMHFSTLNDTEKKKMTFFVDKSPVDKVYNKPDDDAPSSGELITEYSVKRGLKINKLCVGADISTCIAVTSMDVMFLRPDPNAIITANGNGVTTYSYAYIEILSPDGTSKKIEVRKTGQIEITD